jgi:DNA mismatch endonuclease, patch repair protein
MGPPGPTPPASSPGVRKRMQRTPQRDTPPERRLRSALHARGLRFRIQEAPLGGLRRHADIVFRADRVAVFVDGCFWHACEVPRDAS